ncbi:hypothetical protein NLJ89_g10976 [Agrocybe chaxingu]|uniref:Uncharacterized protein n=1 Tax=Agrocybe chaxingu TaxID=84603 RepID=A0A9W8MPS8_9AGAR|nr:hypothetical protein NLJ89_g10976 [Agrocybe chaxingu]
MHLQPAFAFAVANVLLGVHESPTALLLDRRGRPYQRRQSNASLPPAVIALLDSSTSRQRTRPHFPHPSHLEKPTFHDDHDDHDTVGTGATSSHGIRSYSERKQADDDDGERDTR